MQRNNYRSVIIGAGAYGEVYLSYLKEVQVNVIGFIDDDPVLEGKVICGCPVLGNRQQLKDLKDQYGIEAVYCPLGNNALRVDFLKEAKALGLAAPSFIHPTVIIAPDVEISSEGVYILANTQIMPHVVIDDFVMVSTGSNIIHHTHLCEGAFVSNGVNLGANIWVKELAYIGMGATVMTGVKEVGYDALIGAGATVIRNVPDYAVVAGVPAKVIKYKELIDSKLGGVNSVAQSRCITFKSINYAA
jgi:sugar O-acyltransferase (sialic acid O-acetyltransferase NeuD family)